MDTRKGELLRVEEADGEEVCIYEGVTHMTTQDFEADLLAQLATEIERLWKLRKEGHDVVPAGKWVARKAIVMREPCVEEPDGTNPEHFVGVTILFVTEDGHGGVSNYADHYADTGEKDEELANRKLREGIKVLKGLQLEPDED